MAKKKKPSGFGAFGRERRKRNEQRRKNYAKKKAATPAKRKSKKEKGGFGSFGKGVRETVPLPELPAKGRGKTYRKYDFRFATERERFFTDIRQDKREILKALEEQFGDDVDLFNLRFVVDIGEHTSTDRKKAQNTGKFRGVRTFFDLNNLRRFLESDERKGSGISWGEKDFNKNPISARWCYYKKNGAGRILGEKVLQKYFVQENPEFDETAEDEDEDEG